VPRKPTLSPTKLTTYLACPLKYRFTYLDTDGRWYLKAKSYYSFGSTLHAVLQRFHDPADTQVVSLDEVVTAYEESWIDAGYAGADEMQEAFGEGRRILELHVAAEAQKPMPAETVFVERQLRADLGEFVLIGRIDRVDRLPDGGLEIIDYKSGRAVVTEEDVKSDLAMACYQLLVRRNYPNEPVSARILAVRSQSTATASLTEKELAEFERDLIALGREVLNFDLDEHRPRWLPNLCPTCDFLPLCRRDPEFDEIATEAERSAAAHR